VLQENPPQNKAFLRDEHGNPIIKADLLRQLRLQKAWSIPQFAGRLPGTPDEGTSAEDKAKFILFTMLLFRPWRKPVAEMKLACNLDACRDDVDVAYASIWAEYDRWFKEDIEAVAMPYYKGDLASSAWPTYSNANLAWWACLIQARVRQWRFAMQRVQDTVPMTTVGDLPVISDDEMNSGEAAGKGGDGGDSGDERLSDDGLLC